MYTTWQEKYALLPAFGDLLLHKPDSSPASAAAKGQGSDAN
jgi:hypothetical protein